MLLRICTTLFIYSFVSLAPALADDDDLLGGDDDLLTDESPSKATKAKDDDDLLSDDSDDLLSDEPETKPAAKKPAPMKAKKAVHQAKDPHQGIFTESQFPSATQCATCHKKIYDEWRISNHAYASISPMFHKFEQKITDLTGGSIAHFCVRCHISVGTTLGEPREMPIWKRAKVSREGVTCITCHRVKEEFGKVNGERRIEPGEIYAPMYGPDGSGLKKVIAKKDYYKVTPQKGGTGVPIHSKVIQFETIKKSEFCMGCHQVAVHPGIKLEVVWDQYRASPAHSNNISCQECHMGKVPGAAKGYARGPAAVVNGFPINPKRKHSNHSFYGPGYAVAHPGIYPHHPEAENFTIKEWLEFDHRSDWGKDRFEQLVDKGKIKTKFPEAWDSVDDRIEARTIVKDNIKSLEKKRELRRQVMENGSKIDGPFFDDSPKRGEDLDFHYVISNINPGHNLPSGSLGAQPELWLNVAVVNPQGKNIWESGYVDSHGDMADLHSLDVQQGKIPHDDQLFNLQTKFLTTNIKGTEREMFLPVNFDVDQIPHIRPAGAPNSVLNHPNGVRMESSSIPPNSSRKVKYEVPGELLKKPGKYKMAVRMRTRAEPIYFMKYVGATTDMIRGMNARMMDLHPYTVEFQVK